MILSKFTELVNWGSKNANPSIGPSPAPGYHQKEPLSERGVTLQPTLKGWGTKPLDPSHETAPRRNSLLVPTLGP